MDRAPTYFIEQVGGLVVPSRLAESYLEAHGQSLPTVIYPEIRALTADKPTLNKTLYPEKSLRGKEVDGTGLISFTRPYPIPMIKDHRTGGGFFGGEASEVYGRIVKRAQLVKDEQEKYIRVLPSITHPEAIEGILTGRWLTVSLGSNTESVECTVCGQELTDGFCDHQKGNVYEVDGQEIEALWRIGPIRAKELSFVVTPSDDQAGVLNADTEQRESLQRLSAFTRIFVGDERGVFDLKTGKRIQEGFDGLSPIRSLRGFHFLGANPISRKEAYHGAGDYTLAGMHHTHTATVDGNGNGVSSKNDGHTHDIRGGKVMMAGTDSHTHELQPKKKKESEDDEPLTYADLFLLDPSDSDASRTDVPDATEAKLTTKQRDRLPGKAFCGPDRSFPAHDKSHVRAGLSLLGRAKLSSAQKARVRACLIRKGKAMGMKFDDKEFCEDTLMTFTHAARLVDTEHRVEIDLYPLPHDSEALTRVLTKLEQMPHTTEEREQILGRIAAHCKPLIEASEWQQHFGNLAEVEAGEPIAIEITKENYALVYSAAQFCVEDFLPSTQEQQTEETETQPEGDGSQSDAEKVEETTETTETEQTEESETKDDEADPNVVELMNRLKQIQELRPSELAEKVTVEELTTANRELSRKLSEALAHSVALYMTLLRKPQARGKTHEQLVEKMGSRGVDSLFDTLQDLSEEWSASPTRKTSQLPRVSDPTKEEPETKETETTDTSESDTSQNEEETTETAPAYKPPILISDLDEWEMDDDEPILYQLVPELKGDS